MVVLTLTQRMRTEPILCVCVLLQLLLLFSKMQMQTLTLSVSDNVPMMLAILLLLKQCSCFKIGHSPNLEGLHYFRSEQYRLRHRFVDADAQCKLALKVSLIQNRTQFVLNAMIAKQATPPANGCNISVVFTQANSKYRRTYVEIKRTKMACHSCTLPIQCCAYSVRYINRLTLWSPG